MASTLPPQAPAEYLIPERGLLVLKHVLAQV